MQFCARIKKRNRRSSSYSLTGHFSSIKSATLFLTDVFRLQNVLLSVKEIVFPLALPDRDNYVVHCKHHSCNKSKYNTPIIPSNFKDCLFNIPVRSSVCNNLVRFRWLLSIRRYTKDPTISFLAQRNFLVKTKFFSMQRRASYMSSAQCS